MSLPLRIAAGLAALVLAVFPVLRWQEDQAARRELARTIEPVLSDEMRASALQPLAREPDLERARGEVARVLLQDALRQVPQSRARARRRLELARDLATVSWRQRPTDWTAAMTLGGATYLAGTLGLDNRVLLESYRWEGPLVLATELAPSRADAGRLLAMIYLEIWQLMPDFKREQARDLIREGLTHPPTFERLIEPWLATADDLDDALDLLPAQPFAWERTRDLLRQRRDWSGFCAAADRTGSILQSDFDRRIESAVERQLRGDAVGARFALLTMIGELPVDGRYADTFERLMTALSPGPVGGVAGAAIQRWLDWSLDLCAVGRCPLPPPLIGRLAALDHEPSPLRSALAALAAGDLAGAELIERRRWRPDEPGWSAYHLAKTAALLDRRATDEAREAFALVPLGERGGVRFWQTARRLAVAGGDAAATALADRQLEELGGRRWESSDWQRPLPSQSRLGLLADRPAAAVVVRVAGVGSAGDAVLARWDGTTVACEPVGPGVSTIEISLDVEPGHHQLELASADGAPLSVVDSVLVGR